MTGSTGSAGSTGTAGSAGTTGTVGTATTAGTAGTAGNAGAAGLLGLLGNRRRIEGIAGNCDLLETHTDTHVKRSENGFPGTQIIGFMEISISPPRGITFPSI